MHFRKDGDAMFSGRIVTQVAAYSGQLESNEDEKGSGEVQESLSLASPEVPLSRELETYTAVGARFWPRLSGGSLSTF